MLRFGFLANFLSHPVISGFISASGLLIAASQLMTLMGVKAEGHSLLALQQALARQVQHTHWLTLMVGAAATRFLSWVRNGLKPLLMGWGLAAKPADIIAKAGPVAAITVTTLLAWSLDWQAQGMPRSWHRNARDASPPSHGGSSASGRRCRLRVCPDPD